jgi:DNA polymerase III subunit alpha
MSSYTTCTLARLPDSGTVRVAGHVLSVRRMTTKKGNLMARFVLEDLEGEAEITVFPKGLTPEVNELITPNSMVVVKGQVENREQGGRQLLAEEIISMRAARDRFIRQVIVTVPPRCDDATFQRLHEVFGRHPGNCRVLLLMTTAKGDRVLIETHKGIKTTDAFVADLESVVGPSSWSFGKTPLAAASAAPRPAAPPPVVEEEPVAVD